jgi:hypothetical protein
MDGSLHRGPVEPPFGCRPLALVSIDRRPRYFAENGFVIVTASRRRMNIAAAYAEALLLLSKSVDPDIGTLADAYRDELSDLIDAMREASGTPTPPASIARAAA